MAKSEGEVFDIKEDLRQYKQQFNREYGWYFRAKEISQWMNISYLSLFELPASTVLGVYGIMKAENEINISV